jgi:hypothetical protein
VAATSEGFDVVRTSQARLSFLPNLQVNPDALGRRPLILDQQDTHALILRVAELKLLGVKDYRIANLG